MKTEDRTALFAPYLNLDSPFGGMSCFRYLEKAAIESGFTVKWSGFAGNELDRSDALVEYGPPTMWKALRLSGRTRDEMRGRNYRALVVGSNFTPFASRVARMARRIQPRTKLVYYMHDPVPEAYELLSRSGSRRFTAWLVKRIQFLAEKELCRLSDYVLVPGPSVEAIVRSRNAIRGEVVIVPNVHSVLDLGPSDRSEMKRIREQFSLDGCTIILYSGKIQRHLRGIEDQLEVTARLIHKGYPIKYVITGKGDSTHFQQIAHQLRVPDHVVLTGVLSERQLTALMYLSDAMIVPPIHYLAPSKVYEALYCGIPLLCYRKSLDIASLLGDDGMYYDGSKEDMERALVRLLTNIEEWRSRMAGDPRVRLLKIVEDTRVKLLAFFNGLASGLNAK